DAATTVGPAAPGLIIALITESETPAAFKFLNPSTPVSKLIASPAALIARIFAMITSSVSPSFVMLITSSSVNLFLIPPLSWPKQQAASPKPNKTQINLAVRTFTMNLISPSPSHNVRWDDYRGLLAGSDSTSLRTSIAQLPCSPSFQIP